MDVRTKQSRIAAARSRAAGAKRTLAIGAACAFGAAMLLARITHPGAAAASSASTSGSTTSQQSLQTPSSLLDELDANSSAASPPISSAPAQGSPQVQTGSS